MHFFFPNDGTIGPSDLARLVEVFDAVCEQECLSHRSAAADEVAKRIMQVYRAGVRDRAIFMTVIQNRAKRIQ